MSNRICPKCGNTWVHGPRFERGPGGERLVYTCPCGYAWNEACLDAKDEKPRWTWRDLVVYMRRSPT